MTREQYKADLLEIYDTYPGIDVKTIARALCRVESWVAELLHEALKEREAVDKAKSRVTLEVRLHHPRATP